MTRQAQKDLERRQVAFVLRQFPERFPEVLQLLPGREGGERDVILETTDGRRIAIEVTALRAPQRLGDFTLGQVEATRASITRWSREIYGQAGAPRVCMNGYISPGPYPEPRAIARFVADVVRSRAGAGTVAIDLFPAQGAPVELHLAVWPCDDGDEMLWSLAAVGETMSLDAHFLQGEIQRKERTRKQKPADLDEVWLMLVSTMFPSSADFFAPHEAEHWKFQHGFDRICVYVQSNQVLLEY